MPWANANPAEFWAIALPAFGLTLVALGWLIERVTK